MKKILILGGSSDIGLELLKKILVLNKFIIHIHCNKNTIKKDYLKNIKIIKVDLNKITYKNLLNKFDNNYDIIINLVGYVSNQSFLNFNINELNKTLRINSFIPLMIMRASLNHMIKNKYGRIVNTSSIGTKFGGGDNTFSYSLSKHVNEFIPKYIRKLCSKNIIYNTLKIGVINTKFHKKINNKILKKRINLIPIKKMGSSDEIAEYIYYLISRNNFIVNENINISGGE
jgi:3-oxoacyl-[acyl-carrier protein] reductase